MSDQMALADRRGGGESRQQHCRNRVRERYSHGFKLFPRQ
jgi:hypothetical protein